MTNKKQQEPVDDVAARLSEEVTFEEANPDASIEVPVLDVTTEKLSSTIPDVIDSPASAKEAHLAISTMDIEALKAELKAQIMSELKDDQVRKMELEKERRERETAEQQSYVARMKQSPDPWVDIIGWVKDSNGVKTELEWNDAFVDYLRAEGVTGVDDDAVVQKWVVVLMHDMANRMDEEHSETVDSEFEG